MATAAEVFEYTLQKYGPLVGGPSPDLINSAQYRGQIPDSLLDFWNTNGQGMWLEGYFQFCDPSRFAPILNIIFKSDQDFKPEQSHIIGFSAFGRLLVWNEDYRVMYIDLVYHIINCQHYFKPANDVDPDITISSAVLAVNSEAMNCLDSNNSDLFNPAVKAYGLLEHGQVYAPRLHPALGGEILLDNFWRVSALEAFAICAQAGPFKFTDISVPTPRIEREI